MQKCDSRSRAPERCVEEFFALENVNRIFTQAAYATSTSIWLSPSCRIVIGMLLGSQGGRCATRVAIPRIRPPRSFASSVIVDLGAAVQSAGSKAHLARNSAWNAARPFKRVLFLNRKLRSRQLYSGRPILSEQPASEPQEVPDGERMTATALFADLKGSTWLMEELEP
jgi:hypothetical protein